MSHVTHINASFESQRASQTSRESVPSNMCACVCVCERERERERERARTNIFVSHICVCHAHMCVSHTYVCVTHICVCHAHMCVSRTYVTHFEICVADFQGTRERTNELCHVYDTHINTLCHSLTRKSKYRRASEISRARTNSWLARNPRTSSCVF